MKLIQVETEQLGLQDMMLIDETWENSLSISYPLAVDHEGNLHIVRKYAYRDYYFISAAETQPILSKKE